MSDTTSTPDLRNLAALAADIEDALLRWHGDQDDAETLQRVADDLHALAPRAIEHAPDCRPEHMGQPDDEGIRDCANCGIWEYPAR